MFTPLKIFHSSKDIKTNVFLPDTFGIICWNVHKNDSRNDKFISYLENIEKNFDLILFQEANFLDNKNFILSNFSFDAAANLKLKNKFYGVLTASKYNSINAQAYLSKGKEGIFGTHKSFLFSKYFFRDFQELAILNVHAINFRENSHFLKEMQSLISLINSHKGAMIVAGDFNTWNKKRLMILKILMEDIGLKIVKFENEKYIKSFMGNRLDFIFYKNLKPIDAFVDIQYDLSDHNPLFAKFEK